MPVHHMHTQYLQRPEQTLKLEPVVSCCVGSGNQTQVLSGKIRAFENRGS